MFLRTLAKITQLYFYLNFTRVFSGRGAQVELLYRKMIRFLFVHRLDIFQRLRTWVRILKAHAIPTAPIPTTVTLCDADGACDAISNINLDCKSISVGFSFRDRSEEEASFVSDDVVLPGKGTFDSIDVTLSRLGLYSPGILHNITKN